MDAASSNLSEHARVAPLDATFEPAEPEEDDILKESEPKKWDEVADQVQPTIFNKSADEFEE